MALIIVKVVIGIIVGIAAFPFAQEAMYINSVILCILWGVGIIYSLGSYLSWMRSALTASFQLSVMSWMTFGTGLLGFIALTFMLAFVIVIGWIYGWYRLIRDIILML